MPSARFLLQCGLLALPTYAQVVGQPYPNFELRTEPPTSRTTVVAGHLSAGRNPDQGVIVEHRYFYNEAAHTYYGYDVVIQPELLPNRYGVSYYDLSIGPLDFSDAPADALNPALWKKLPLPALPLSHSIRIGEAFENVVFVDPSTGQRLIDSMDMMPASQTSPPRSEFGAARRPVQFNIPSSSTPKRIAYRGPGVRLPDDFTIPTVPGPAREFTLDDAEISIEQARVTINDIRQPLASSGRPVNGTLLWFYVPNHGRYVLSLFPRRELGFVQAGEIRGGAASFTIGSDRFRLETPKAIASGNAPYLLYVLSDPAWLPTLQTTSDTLLVGTVSPAELAALTRK